MCQTYSFWSNYNSSDSNFRNLIWGLFDLTSPALICYLFILGLTQRMSSSELSVCHIGMVCNYLSQEM